MLSSKCSVALVIALSCPVGGYAASKPHIVGLGAVRHEPYSVQGDPAGAQTDETTLNVRPLIVDGKVKEWTTGEAHDVTERSFVVRRAVRLNDSLPGDRGLHWVWQRGPWLLIDRGSGKITALHLPDFDPGVSHVVWFRDYAAYCGLTPAATHLLAVVAQITARRPLLAKKLAAWDASSHPTPACTAPAWQREPLAITFGATGAPPVTVDLVGNSAILVEDGDSDTE